MHTLNTTASEKFDFDSTSTVAWLQLADDKGRQFRQIQVLDQDVEEQHMTYEREGFSAFTDSDLQARLASLDGTVNHMERAKTPVEDFTPMLEFTFIHHGAREDIKAATVEEAVWAAVAVFKCTYVDALIQLESVKCSGLHIRRQGEL